MVVLYWR